MDGSWPEFVPPSASSIDDCPNQPTNHYGRQSCTYHGLLHRRNWPRTVCSFDLLQRTMLMTLRVRCEEFAAQGCKVYATARRLEALQNLTRPNVEKLTLDVTVDANVQEAVKIVIEREGQVDILVNSAGALHVGNSNNNIHSGICDDRGVQPLLLKLPWKTCIVPSTRTHSRC